MRANQFTYFSLQPLSQARAGAGASRQHDVTKERLPEGGVAGGDAEDGQLVDARGVSSCRNGQRKNRGAQSSEVLCLGCSPPVKALGGRKLLDPRQSWVASLALPTARPLWLQSGHARDLAQLHCRTPLLMAEEVPANSACSPRALTFKPHWQ
jgi:hypothetical protein